MTAASVCERPGRRRNRGAGHLAGLDRQRAAEGMAARDRHRRHGRVLPGARTWPSSASSCWCRWSSTSSIRRHPASAYFLSDRTYVGTEQYQRLLDCGNYLDPLTCREDLFWKAVHNTALFVVLQVALLTVVSMITALILNREIVARSFWRAVFFFPVLLSPVVVGLIWRWILQRQGLLNFILFQFGAEPHNWLTDRFWAFAGADHRLGLGAYGLLHAHPACRPAGDPARSLRGGRDGRHQAGAGSSGASRCRC